MNIRKFCPLPLCGLIKNFLFFVYCFFRRYLAQLGLRQLGAPNYYTYGHGHLKMLVHQTGLCRFGWVWSSLMSVFHNAGHARKQPIKQPIETQTITMALMGHFPSLIVFLGLNGSFLHIHFIFQTQLVFCNFSKNTFGKSICPTHPQNPIFLSIFVCNFPHYFSSFLFVCLSPTQKSLPSPQLPRKQPTKKRPTKRFSVLINQWEIQ